MRWIVPLFMLCAGCRVAPNKPLEVGLILNYNLPNGQGTVQMEVRK